MKNAENQENRRPKLEPIPEENFQRENERRQPIAAGLTDRTNQMAVRRNERATKSNRFSYGFINKL